MSEYNVTVTTQPVTYNVTVIIGGTFGGGGGGATNLSTSRTATAVTVASDTGTDAVIGAASSTLAGVMTAADRIKLDGLDGAAYDASGAAAAAVSDHAAALNPHPIYLTEAEASALFAPIGSGGGGGGASWGGITGTLSNQADLQAALNGKQVAGSYAAAVHGHVISDVAGLQTALDAKQAAGSYAATSHGHAIGDVTGLQTALDGKQAAGSYAASSHGHAIADVTGLQTALDGKQAAGSYAAASHGHALADITQSGATTGQVPTWNGSAWAPATPSGGGGSGLPAGGSAGQILQKNSGTDGDASWVEHYAVKQLSADVANSTTVDAAIADLSYAATANGLYKVTVVGGYQTANSTTGIKFVLTASGSGSSVMHQNLISINVGGNSSARGGGSFGATTATATDSVTTSNTPYTFSVQGIVKIGGSGGNIGLSFASEVGSSAATVLSTAPGTVMSIERLL